MAFIVEDGTGVANANAYIDIAFADNYFAERGITAWTGDDTAKEQAIIKATDYIELRFIGSFKGTKETIAQGLSWPRTGAVDPNGDSLEEVPLRLKKATAEYAVRTISAALLPDPTTDASGRTVTRIKEKVGPIETETAFSEDGGSTTIIKPYPAADKLLTGLINATNIAVR